MSGLTEEVSSGYVNVDWVLTKYVFAGGRDIHSKPKRLVLIIPGNPGLCGFYETLVSRLWSGLGESVDAVWCVSHAGHDALPAMPNLEDNKHIYSLEGQIKHKLDFLETAELPPDSEITLIGHSMGCHVILQAMKKRAHNIKAAYFLFPMIERMAQTPQGSTFFFQHLSQVKLLLVFLTWCLTWLPSWATDKLIRTVQSCKDQPSLQAIKDYLNPGAVKACIHLAEHEMLEIKDLDLESLDSFKDQIRMLYGKSDGWAPVHFYHNLITILPGYCS